jgi:hypothetical protein
MTTEDMDKIISEYISITVVAKTINLRHKVAQILPKYIKFYRYPNASRSRLALYIIDGDGYMRAWTAVHYLYRGFLKKWGLENLWRAVDGNWIVAWLLLDAEVILKGEEGK